MFGHFITPSLALAGATVITSYYGLRIYSSIILPPELNITTSDTIPDSFARSVAVNRVNPHHHVTINDSRSVVIPISNSLSHEQILAKFLSGFFNGYVFAPEQTALRLVGRQLVNFEQLDGTPVAKHIWAPSEISDMRLPLLHSVLFGAFRIVDVQVSSSGERPLNSSEAQPSRIDIAFGADDGFIAGVHRFSVSDLDNSTIAGQKRQVAISFDHTSCNPRENKPLGPDVLQTFHLWYAMLLFREGISKLLKTS